MCLRPWVILANCCVYTLQHPGLDLVDDRTQTIGRLLHPEATRDEVCIGNIFASDFSPIGWATKRLGRVSLNTFDGTPLKGGNMRPVFASRKEIEDVGVAIPATGPIDHRW